jgi:riboflavin transporter FmnP
VTTRNSAILGFTIGYVGMAAIVAGIGYFCLMPFGYGFIAAELIAAYFGWATIQQWDALNASLGEYLEQHCE